MLPAAARSAHTPTPHATARRVQIPRLCLGTFKLTTEGLKRGLNRFQVIDLAKAYSNPDNEDMMGRAMREAGKLEQTIVITKLHEPCLQSFKVLRDSILDSTQKIGKVPDVVLIHAPYPNVNMLAVAEMLKILKKDGTVKEWGVSNFNKERLQFLAHYGYIPAVNQVECHPYFPRNDLANLCHTLGILFQAYRPLVEGKVLGEPVLKAIADKYKIDSASVVYNWLYQQGRGIVTKVSSEENQAIYASTGSITLTELEMEWIATLKKPNGQGRTCTKGGWFVPFTDEVKKTWALNFPIVKHSDLKLQADALNIEGGLIPTRHFTPGKNQVWANVGAVLDRPYLDGLDWDELSKKNSYPLKETFLADYNEGQVSLAHATLLKYYVNHAHEVAKKASGENVTLVVQIHRGTSGKIQLDQLTKILEICFPNQFQSQPVTSHLKNVKGVYHNAEKNITVELRWGYTPETIGNYENAHIVLSLSLVAGFKESLSSGSLVIPKTFIPTSLKEMTISKDKAYVAPNDVAFRLAEIVKEQTPELIEEINKNFRSPNPQKQDLKASLLGAVDFTEVTLLEVDDIFVPNRLPESIFKIRLASKL